MVIGVTEIAKRAGVSKGTVSRYLNGDPTLKIRPETKEKIDTIREQIGIKMTSAQRTKRKLARNFVIPVNRVFRGTEAITSPSFLQMCKAMEDLLGEHHFHVSIVFFDGSNKCKDFSNLISSPDFCDGILLLTNTANAELAKLILESKVPHVSVNPRDEELGLNTVVAHSLLGIRQAVKHLKNLGHINIGFVGLQRFYRYSQFVSVLIEENLPFDDKKSIFLPEKDPTTSEKHWREIARESFLKHIKESKPLTSAYLCQNDLIAFGAIDAMRKVGIRPGRDISIVGYDNLEERAPSEDIIPGLTTIDNPLDVVGRRCGQILLNQVFGHQRDIVHEHIPTKLIVRKTTGPYTGG